MFLWLSTQRLKASWEKSFLRSGHVSVCLASVCSGFYSAAEMLVVSLSAALGRYLLLNWDFYPLTGWAARLFSVFSPSLTPNWDFDVSSGRQRWWMREGDVWLTVVFRESPAGLKCRRRREGGLSGLGEGTQRVLRRWGVTWRARVAAGRREAEAFPPVAADSCAAAHQECFCW